MTSSPDLLRFVRAHRDDLVLSVYVEGIPSDPAERERWRVHLRNGFATAREALGDASREEREAFERCAALVSERLTSRPERGDNGWACFCTADGEIIDTTLPEGDETSVSWGLGVRIVPYLRVADESAENAIIVQLDRRQAVVSQLRDGTLHELFTSGTEETHKPARHMGDTPRYGFHQGKRGVAVTDDIQRQRREATERLFSTVQKRLATLAEGGLPIVIGGTPETTAHFVNTLPTSIASRCVVTPALNPQSTEAETTEAVRAALRILRSRLQARRVSALHDAAFADGRAAVGFQEAARAADLGAIAELIFSDRAWRENPEEIEALVQRALADGADVTFASKEELEAAAQGDDDGVLAGLRFPVPDRR